MRTRFRPVPASACCALALFLAVPLGAQRPAPDLRNEAVVVGSDAERYLRVLQVAGAAPLYPWSIRGFSPAEVDRLLPDTAAHPWRDRLPSADSAPGTLRVRGVRPQAGLTYNSAFPQGTNDGALWTGRGLTAAVSAGVEVRVGSALSLRVEPLAFWSQNRSFPLLVDGRPDSLRFTDPYSPGGIDLPQRFGDGSFVRVDPGQSTLRLDGRGFAAGVSTANQQWGTAVDQPLLLGPTAAGFPHAFLGTSTPWNVGLGRLHGRVVWGSLGQSAYSEVRGHGSRRLMTGVVGVFLPARLTGLELGVARFFHEPWPEGGVAAADLTRPLESFYKGNLGGRDEPGGPPGVENQLAMGFFRWTLPASRFEVYGEFLREDHNYDLEDLILEPDRSSGYLLGGRKVWGRDGVLRTVRAEWVNTTPSHLKRGAHQGLPYHHSSTRQGHTVHGQLLGSPAAYGGGGSVVALEAFTPRGRWSVDWTRARISAPRRTSPRGAPLTHSGWNVVHSLGGEVVAFRGRLDLVARVRGSWELNRHYADDAFNLNASLGVRVGL
ncbi:MAG: capsule assembly Wzi family protein [Gemmatimonadetes bacterium]|nr:capsule assembly Wzi family protein [Gemmatimonadota bacterium]